MLIDKTIVEFLEATASNSPVPGGGSIAAQSGAAAAALTEMVANLTIGKKNYEGVSGSMMDISKKAALLRTELLLDIDRDSDSYAKVMEAYKLPKDTDDEKEARAAEIQTAMKLAATVPLTVARKSKGVMDLAKEVVTSGNSNAITDGAVAGMLARTAVLAAIYNVKINLGSIRDEEFKARVSKEIEALKADIMLAEQDIFDLLSAEGL